MISETNKEVIIIVAPTISQLAVGALEQHEVSQNTTSKVMAGLIFECVGDKYPNTLMLQELTAKSSLTLIDGSPLDICLTRFINTLSPLTTLKVDSISKDISEIYDAMDNGHTGAIKLYNLLVKTLSNTILEFDDSLDQSNVFTLLIELYVVSSNDLKGLKIPDNLIRDDQLKMVMGSEGNIHIVSDYLKPLNSY